MVVQVCLTGWVTAAVCPDDSHCVVLVGGNKGHFCDMGRKEYCDDSKDYDLFQGKIGVPGPGEPQYCVGVVLVAPQQLHILRFIYHWGRVALSITVLYGRPQH
ncbi:hypothetical protein E2C01_030560 [Portunus trituberculatus]|uniref:Uncharacterized protein n=1 Tax=Portunus trituberculatus TaxID=210409 RepID=A0A5B7EV59_PORTR|nr:hypothetical protein [Portunus trituberculatus]